MRVAECIKQLGKKIIEGLEREKLAPLDRLERLRRFEEADRVTGSFAFWTPSSIGINEISTKEYYSNPEKMYFCQLKALDIFHHDYPLLFADNYNTEPEALGARIGSSSDDTPVIVEPALKQKNDLYKLQLPDPLKDGRLPYRIEICRIHQETLGKYFPTITSINAPFSMAVGMRGYETIILDMAEDPDFVHNLLEFCTHVIIAFGEAIKSACGSYPSLSDAWSSIPNLSPDLFLEFSFPYATRCLEVFQHSGWSFGGGHQFADDWKKSLRRILTSGTKSLMLFEENITGVRGGRIIDLREIKQMCKRYRVFLYTAIHPDTMLRGPSNKIEGLMANWITQVASGGGHGFYTSVLSGTPLDHIRAFVNTMRNFAFPIRNDVG